MAMMTNTVSRYDSTNVVREDLSDMIYNISPTETPMMNNFGRDKATNTLFEWNTDILAAASTTNAQFEGDDVVSTTDAIAATTRVQEYTQIARKLITVSDTTESVDKAGMRSMMAYQLAKKSNELKRDMEATISSRAVAAAGDNTTARKTAGLGSWIITNCVIGAGSTAAKPVMSSGGTSLSGYPATAAIIGTTLTTFTETMLKANIKAVWVSGVEPTIAMCGPFNKGLISGFSGIATRFRDVPAGKQAQIVGAADVYVSDFGTLSIVPNRFQPENMVYVFDPKYASVSYLRPFQTIVLAKTGDAERRMLLVEFGLRVKNEAAFADTLAVTTT